MDLVNSSPVPARIFTSMILDASQRIGLVVAKATFRFSGATVSLETDDPLPLFNEDRETLLGLLPRDDFPRRDAAFEVVVLGAAYSPTEQPTTHRRVVVSVGNERRSLDVFGDRVWEGRKENARISAPMAYQRMPLTHERAFGGTCRIEVDRDAFLDATDPNNPAGRGFNASEAAESLGQMLGAPEGYPRFDPTRRLPNLEDPASPIRAWGDAPRPVYWGAVPMSSGLHAARSVVSPGQGESEPLVRIDDAVYHRAHPDWVIARPERGSLLRLAGLFANREERSFCLPSLRILVDYVADGRSGTRELMPHGLVVLPEEECFTLVYRHAFAFRYPGGERSMRLRLEQGWFSASGVEG